MSRFTRCRNWSWGRMLAKPPNPDSTPCASTLTTVIRASRVSVTGPVGKTVRSVVNRSTMATM